MREIDFRAWDKMEKIMSEVTEISWDEDRICTKDYLGSWRRFELMQFTGLKDKNGKKIYESDIINHLSYLNSPDMNTEAWRVEIVENLQDFFKSIGCRENDSEAFDPDHLEIIGNIYQNPGLLKS